MFVWDSWGRTAWFSAQEQQSRLCLCFRTWTCRIFSWVCTWMRRGSPQAGGTRPWLALWSPVPGSNSSRASPQFWLSKLKSMLPLWTENCHNSQNKKPLKLSSAEFFSFYTVTRCDFERHRRQNSRQLVLWGWRGEPQLVLWGWRGEPKTTQPAKTV